MNLPIALATLLVVVCSTCADAVGFQHVNAPDPDGAPLDIGIWYPSDTTPAPLAMGPVTQTVAVRGALLGQAFPLIVISHGTGGSYLSHYDTAIALAQAGYVVASVAHPGDNYADQSRSVFIMERPRHISRLIDYMLATWSDHARIDPERVGMFGFSAGGFTTLVSIGGVADLLKVGPFCREHPTDFACQLVARRSGAGAPATPEGRDGSRDLRIKAAVIAAPALGFTFSHGGLEDVTVPVQLWRAEDDVILPNPGYAEAVRQALPQAPEYHVVPKAGHYDFLAPCGERFAAIAPEICMSAKGFDRAAFHADFNASVVGFFDRTLGR